MTLKKVYTIQILTLTHTLHSLNNNIINQQMKTIMIYQQISIDVTHKKISEKKYPKIKIDK